MKKKPCSDKNYIKHDTSLRTNITRFQSFIKVFITVQFMVERKLGPRLQVHFAGAFSNSCFACSRNLDHPWRKVVLIQFRICFKWWTYPFGISPMIDTAKFAFILAPYEIAVPPITCWSNKRRTNGIITSCVVLWNAGKTRKRDGSISRFSPSLPLPFYPCN